MLQLSLMAVAHADPASPPSDGDWNVALGVTVLRDPRFPGSSESKTKVYPMGQIEYGNRFFIKGDTIPGASIRGIGIYLHKDSHWTASASLAPDFTERRSQDAARLHGLPDVANTVRAALAVSYERDWWKVSSGVTQDLSSAKKEGLKGGVDFLGTYHATPQLMLSAGPGITFANGENTRTYFGITRLESVRSGLAVYDPSGGLNTIRVSAGLHYRIAGRWFAGAFASESQLRGDAANSPVVEKKQQLAVGGYVDYRF